VYVTLRVHFCTTNRSEKIVETRGRTGNDIPIMRSFYAFVHRRHKNARTDFETVASE